MTSPSRNDLAKKLKSLHIPGESIVLMNVYDAATAAVVCAHPSTKAIATASFAFAATLGIEDEELSQSQNLEGVAKVAKIVEKHSRIPLSADLQDGYDIETAIPQMIKLGVVGCNIEDLNNSDGSLRDVDDAVSRIKRVLTAAEKAGVPDFCVNARTDVLGNGGSIEDVIERGKVYLEAGATTVYVWGGIKGRGVSREEVKQIVEALGGMINVKLNLRPGFLTLKEIKELGVVRVSVGPELWRAAMKGFSDGLDAALV